MPRQGLTKDIIISKSIDIINLVGYQKLTFVILAKELDVKPPAMFKHFKNIEDLKQAIALRAINGLKQDLQNALIGVSGNRAVSSFCYAYRDFASRNPGLYIGLQPVFFKEKKIASAATELMSLIIAVLKGFNIDEKDYIHLLRLIRSSLHGFVILETDYKFGMSKDIAASFQLQVDAILYMIQSYTK